MAARAIAVIKEEHRNLGAVLSCLSALADEVEARGLQPDFKVFHAILNYLDSYLARFHHPKEDAHLFPAVRRRCPQAADTLDELDRQHRQEETLMHGLRFALSSFEAGGNQGAQAFLDAARRYVEFERQHAYLEEREILPLARDHLSEADWTPIDDAFAANEDPLFGKTPQQEYRDLLRTIVNLAPAPHGVAAPWRPTG